MLDKCRCTGASHYMSMEWLLRSSQLLAGSEIWEPGRRIVSVPKADVADLVLRRVLCGWAGSAVARTSWCWAKAAVVTEYRWWCRSAVVTAALGMARPALLLVCGCWARPVEVSIAGPAVLLATVCWARPVEVGIFGPASLCVTVCWAGTVELVTTPGYVDVEAYRLIVGVLNPKFGVSGIVGIP